MQTLRILLSVIFLLALPLGCGKDANNGEAYENYQPVPIKELADNKEAFPVGVKLELVGSPEKVVRKWSTMRGDGLDWMDAFEPGDVYFLKPIGRRNCCGVLIHLIKSRNLPSPIRIQGTWQKKKYGQTDIYYLEVKNSRLAKGLH